MRRYALWLATGVCVAVCSAVILFATLRDSNGAAAVQLPTACENFVVAAELFAKEGSAAAPTLAGNGIFAPEAGGQPADVLKQLLDACQAERATSAP